MAMRNILVETRAPAMSLMLQLGGVSLLMFLFGWTLFKLLKRRFYEFLWHLMAVIEIQNVTKSFPDADERGLGSLAPGRNR